MTNAQPLPDNIIHVRGLRKTFHVGDIDVPALRGADLVAHPTNFPLAASVQTELITRARAAENRVYVLTANRIGKERWAEFCGWSQIVDPLGTRLVEAGLDDEVLLVADVDVQCARDKDYVIPGEYETYLFEHRRPELYGALVKEAVRA